MRRILLTLVVATLALMPVWADGQFRIAGNASTPMRTLPDGGPDVWNVTVPNELTMTGWHWEVIFNHVGLGMHYDMRFYEPIVVQPEDSEWFLDWKGDFFLSYHLFGGGALLDPFVEFGWGNAGSAMITSPTYVDYPDWEDEVAHGNATALSFYNYFAAGLAIDLNGLLLGAKLSYIPSELAQPIPDSSVDFYGLEPFEVSFFGGVALGGHNRRPRHNRDWDWDWD